MRNFKISFIFGAELEEHILWNFNSL
jgi:hypothetical protein